MWVGWVSTRSTRNYVQNVYYAAGRGRSIVRSMSVWQCLSTGISKTTSLNFTNFSVHAAFSSVLWWHSNTLRISGFMDDIILHTMARHGQCKWPTRGHMDLTPQLMQCSPKVTPGGSTGDRAWCIWLLCWSVHCVAVEMTTPKLDRIFHFNIAAVPLAVQEVEHGCTPTSYKPNTIQCQNRFCIQLKFKNSAIQKCERLKNHPSFPRPPGDIQNIPVLLGFSKSHAMSPSRRWTTLSFTCLLRSWFSTFL